MPMSDQEPRDFMTVDSFSQLPFIRSSPSLHKPPPSSSSAIRLFGIEFPHNSSTTDEQSQDQDQDQDQQQEQEVVNLKHQTNSTSTPNGDINTTRKFECHYCCRNFPTSQALGGHQNAHKRERQHAKRAHLHSAMASLHNHHHSTNAHVYGVYNYHRLISSMPSATRFGLGHVFEPPPPPPSSSWSPAGVQFYGGLGSVSQPINGNPLPGLWRVSGATPASKIFAGDGDAFSTTTFNAFSPPPSSSSSSPPSSSVVRSKENVSLDLHL